MEETVKKFIKDLRKDCKKNGIKIELKPSVQIFSNPGLKCLGYFSHHEKVIKVAKNNNQYLAVLIHEAQHLCQYLENTIEWQKDEQFGNQAFEDWINGKEIKNIGRAITNLLALELDCERRALKKITEYDLPINSSTYIQRTNQMCQYYRFVQKYRRWNNKPFTFFEQFPTRFMSEGWYKKLSPKAEKIFLDAGL